MIKRVFKVDKYWKVIVYFNVDYNFFNDIANEIRKLGNSESLVNRVYLNMSTHYAKAVTVSNVDKQVSIVLFNEHKSREDYVNSIVHEAEHVKQAMLSSYNVKDKGENAAYTIGYIASKLLSYYASII